jgi:hypothetical protein
MASGSQTALFAVCGLGVAETDCVLRASWETGETCAYTVTESRQPLAGFPAGQTSRNWPDGLQI